MINRHKSPAIALHFRVLKGWDIRIVKPCQIEASVSINRKARKAFIYDCRGVRPPNFLLHEVLHICMAEICGMDKRKNTEVRRAEEMLVQDICALMPNKALTDSESTKARNG